MAAGTGSGSGGGQRTVSNKEHRAIDGTPTVRKHKRSFGSGSGGGREAGLKSCQGEIGGSGAGGGPVVSRYETVCSYELYPLSRKVAGEKTIGNEGKPSRVLIAVDTRHTWRQS
eukprot:11969220-Ditylum_brightwellii.AAC.1